MNMMDESSEDSVAFVLKYLLQYCGYGFTIVQLSRQSWIKQMQKIVLL